MRLPKWFDSDALAKRLFREIVNQPGFKQDAVGLAGRNGGIFIGKRHVFTNYGVISVEYVLGGNGRISYDYKYIQGANESHRSVVGGAVVVELDREYTPIGFTMAGGRIPYLSTDAGVVMWKNMPEKVQKHGNGHHYVHGKLEFAFVPAGLAGEMERHGYRQIAKAYFYEKAGSLLMNS